MGCKTLIMQGDQYYLPFKIKVDGEYVDVTTVDTIEFVVGDLTKKYPEEVKYDDTYKIFKFYLSQEETFNMRGYPDVQIRLKDTEGYVYGKRYGRINVQYSLSKEVL